MAVGKGIPSVNPGKLRAAEPAVRATDFNFVRTPAWEEIDEGASEWLGHPCLALPSVRVGLCWALEHLGYARHRDHVLVPRFVGRCILNSIGRFAFPVEQPTKDTRIALVVDQFGLRQKLDELRPAFAHNRWLYIEDSPYGIGEKEAPGEGSVGRFIGLGKVFPVVQGALLMTDNAELRAHVRRKRSERTAWSLPVWLSMLVLRGEYVRRYSRLADAAYEMYPAAGGGSSWIRRNLIRVMDRAEEFAREAQARMSALADALGPRILLPELRRVGYLVPFLPGQDLEAARAAFRKHGFDDAPLHIDLDRNMLAPRYVRSLFVPVNPRIPRDQFDALLDDLYDSAARNMEPLRSGRHLTAST